MTTKEIVASIVGRRRVITSADMGRILRAIWERDGADSLGNGYVPLSFDAPSHGQPWLAWQAIVRGINLVSYGRNLLDGGCRYDQPGSMAPCQHSDVTFVAFGGVRNSTLAYLREHCDRLLIIRQEPVEIWLPPGLQRQTAQRYVSPADAAAIEILALDRVAVRDDLLVYRSHCDESLLDDIDRRTLAIVSPEAVYTREVV